MVQTATAPVQAASLQDQTTFTQTEIAGLMRLGIYANQDEVIADGIRNLLLNNPSLRLELALDLIKSDEVSLSHAAEIAGLDRWSFQDIMKERGIKLIIEGDSAEEMDEAIARFFAAKR